MKIKGIVLFVLFLIIAMDPAFAAPQNDQILIKQGDLIPGVGLVTSIRNKCVDNEGNTVIQVDTDNPNLDGDHAVLVNGVHILTEGQAMAMPVGSILDDFNTMNINTYLNNAWWFDLEGAVTPMTDSALYYNTNMLLQEGFPSTAPQFGPSNTINKFQQVLLNEQNHILAILSVNDPPKPVTTDWALVLMTVDASGNLQSETVLLQEGGYMPGQVHKIKGSFTRRQEVSFNDLGQFTLVMAEETVGCAVYVNYNPVAREDTPSPVPGRDWKNLKYAEVDMNNVGGWVIHGELHGAHDSNFLIEKTGQKLVQEGDTLPGIEGFQFTRFGMGPVQIGDTDNALWYGDWDDPDTSRDTGLFLNTHLILQDGVSKVEGKLVELIHGIEFGYHMSPSGEWIIVEAGIENNINSVMLLYIGPWTFLGQGLAGTGGKTPMLRCRSSLEANTPLTIELSNTRPNTSAALVIGFSDISAPFMGGTMVPAPNFLIPSLPVDGNGELTLNLQMPTGVPSGLPIYVQMWPTDPVAPFGYSASNAVKGVTP